MYKQLIAITAVLTLLIACDGQSPRTPYNHNNTDNANIVNGSGGNEGSEEVPAQPNAKTNGRIMIIGMDGTRAEGVQLANTPNLDSLVDDGFADFNGITGDVSLSGPGWSSMLTGVWCDKHRVLDNDATWAQSRFDTYPHFITRLETARPSASTFSVSHWNPINDEILCADERNDNCGGADTVMNVGTDAAVRDAVVDVLQNGNPDVVFMQFDDIDHAGHGDPPFIGSDIGGFCPYPNGDPAGGGVCLAANFNPDYVSTIATTDGYIGDIITALQARPDYDTENWLILVSPDHGGAGTVINQHGFPSSQDRRTFFIVSGEDARSVTDAGQVKMVDVAATALFHLGVELEASWNLDGQAIGVVDAPAYQTRTIPSCFDQSSAAGDSRQ